MAGKRKLEFAEDESDLVISDDSEDKPFGVYFTGGIRSHAVGEPNSALLGCAVVYADKLTRDTGLKRRRTRKLESFARLFTMSTTTITTQTAGVVVAAAASGAQAPFQIPWPKSKAAQRQWQLEQMAGAFRIFAKLGFADGGSGHISLRGWLSLHGSTIRLTYGSID